MKKKWSVIGFICIILTLIFVNMPQKPRMISSVTTFDTAYLTILVDKKEMLNIKKLEEKILKMCKEDLFDEMKLNTEDRSLPENLHISIYTGKSELQKGIIALTFTYKEGDMIPLS